MKNAILHWMGMGIDPAGYDTRPRSVITGNRTPYTGEQLRDIRAVKGVGKRHVGEDRYAPNVDAWVRRCNQVNAMFTKWSLKHEGMERRGEGHRP
jgi:hypothetical protein